MNALGYEEYERLSEGGRPVPVFRELPGDLRTPVSAFLSLAARSERAFLLESVLGGERLAEETADLLYHLLVALHQRGLPLARVMDELRKRRSK